MSTTYILFMGHMHALLDLQHGSNSLVNLGDSVVGQSRTKAMGTIWTCCEDFFQNFLYDYYSAHLDLQLPYSIFLKKLISYIFINAVPIMVG